MTTDGTLQHSYGPEVTPYQQQHSYGPEVTPYQQQHFQAPEPLAPPSKLEHTATEPGTTKKPAQGKRIWGLRIPTLAVIATLIAVSLGVGIGVGVGVGRQTNSNSPPSSSSSSSSSSSILEALPSSEATTSPSSSSSESLTTTQSPGPVTSGTKGIAANSCKSRDPQTYDSIQGATFVGYCFTDWPRGIDASDGDGTVSDLSRDIVYTFEACMDACVEYNSSLDEDEDETQCWAVTYSANLTRSIDGQGANCFLKDKRGVDRLAEGLVASAARIP